MLVWSGLPRSLLRNGETSPWDCLSPKKVTSDDLQCGQTQVWVSWMARTEPFFCLNPGVAFSARNVRCFEFRQYFFFRLFRNLLEVIKSWLLKCFCLFVCLCIYSVCLCAHTGLKVRCHFSLFTALTLGLELQPTDLVASAFSSRPPHWPTLVHYCT